MADRLTVRTVSWRAQVGIRMSEATEKQRERGARSEELAIEPLPRRRPDPRRSSCCSTATSKSTASAASGIPGSARRGCRPARCCRAASRRLPLLRPPRPRLRAGQGDVARRRCSPTCFGRTGGSVGGKGGGTVHFVDPEIGVLGQGGTLGSNFVLGAGAGDLGPAARRGPGGGDLLRRRRRRARHLPRGGAAGRRSGSCRSSGSARTTAGRSRRRSPSRARPRTSPTARPPTACPGWSSTARTRSRSATATAEAVERARAGEGPTLIEAKTLRIRGHYEGDRQHYRDGPRRRASRSRATR